MDPRRRYEPSADLPTNGAATSPSEAQERPDTISPTYQPGDLDGVVGAAVAELTARADHGEGGRFVQGNTAAWKDGSRSRQLPTVLGEAKAELAGQVRSDLALDSPSSTAAETLVGLADAYVETRLLRMSLFATLAQQGGPVTGKGRARAALATYLSVLDREHRLATTLGFTRRQQAVSPLQAVQQAVARANANAVQPTPSPFDELRTGGDQRVPATSHVSPGIHNSALSQNGESE